MTQDHGLPYLNQRQYNLKRLSLPMFFTMYQVFEESAAGS